MRLTEYEILSIRQLAQAKFGKNAHVFLFGSRIDMNKKGGDIDLLIDSDIKSDLTIKAKLEFLTELKLTIGNQKIDVLLNNSKEKSNSLIYKTARQKGIKLC